MGFRHHVRHCAALTGVCGYVRNQVDGSVFILAEANDTVFDSFCAMVKSGNGFSRVDGWELTRLDNADRYKYFEVR